VKLSIGTVGPFLLPVALAAGAVWLGNRAPSTGFHDRLRPIPGVLRIGLPANPPDLDPCMFTDTTSDGILERMGNTLVRYDQDLHLVPDLATSMAEASEGGKLLTFHLRKGVLFQPWTGPDGVVHPPRELTSEDVRYSLMRLMLPWSKRFENVEALAGSHAAQEALSNRSDYHDVSMPEFPGIETPDPLTIRLRLTEPDPFFPYKLAMNNATVVPKEAVAAWGHRFGRQPVGTGPFRLVEWKDNHRITFERFDRYFGEKPALEKIVFYVMPEEETTFQAYLNGDLEVIQAPFGKVRSIEKSNIGGQLVINPLGDTRYHSFNMEKTLRGEDGSLVPFGGNPEKADPPVVLTPDQKERARKIRQAFNYAVDRKALCDLSVLEGRAVPAKGILPPGLKGYNTDLKGYSYDPEKAKRLLAEAGYPEGKGLPVIPYHFNSQPPNPTIAENIQEMLRKVGIRTELKQMDWGAFLPFEEAGNATFCRAAWVMDYPEPENFLYVLLHSKQVGPPGNVSRYQNAEMDRVLDEARSCRDEGKAILLWQEAERMAVEDAPWVFLYHQATALVIKPYVKGMVLTRMDPGPELCQCDLSKVSIEAGDR
jgi:peptide/nickel transport system substrate-binding protein/oligopeptide transport system substrate-binding protein